MLGEEVTHSLAGQRSTIVRGAASVGLDMRVWLSAEPWPGVALVFLLTGMSASSGTDFTSSDNELYEDILSHLAGDSPLNSSSADPPEDWLEPDSPCPPHALLEDIFSQYTSVPRSFLTVARHDACRGLEADGQGMPLRDFSGYRPLWLVDATTAGDCPWHLVRREFLHGTLPAAILEVSCLCDGYRCSVQGDFRCTSVTRQVTVWSSEATGGVQYLPRPLQVTAACVCAQRHAPQAIHVHPGPWK